MGRASGATFTHQRTRQLITNTVDSTGPPVAGYVAWYDATQISGLADGSALASWPDLSANAFNMTQATGANKPTYYKTTSASMINGHPSVSFNGSSDFMANGTLLNSTAPPATMFAVIKAASTAGNPAIGGEHAGGAAFTMQIYTTAVQWEIYSGAALRLGSADTSAHVFTGLFNGASSQILIDNVSKGTGNAGTTAQGTSGYCLGAVSLGPSSFWNGLMGEVIIYTSALSGANMTSTYQYLQAKWGTP
jgi:hypothetical protein